MKKLSQINKFYKISLAIFATLWLIRMVFPRVIKHNEPEFEETPMPPVVIVPEDQQPMAVPFSEGEIESMQKPLPHQSNLGRLYHPILGVRSYDECFPDTQEVQLASAQKYGIQPPRDRAEAELRMKDLVYVGSSPYYSLDPTMKNSIPYLVPRAAIMLNRIGRSFLDSCYVKGLPLHKVIISSVLRTEEDVEKLSLNNINVNRQSCHSYGTTVDVCYTRYLRVCKPGESVLPSVRDDTLKWVLSEVLRDLRAEEVCYVKHEVKQSCFHITVR